MAPAWLRPFLQLLQRQLKLRDLGVQPSEERSKLRASQLGKLRLQPGDLVLTFAQFGPLARDRRRLRHDQRARLFRQGGDVQCHSVMIAACTTSAPMTLA